jgi:hypothetical protein
VVSPNAVTETSDEPTAFRIGIPVASISAGTIRKPPPMPKKPEIAPAISSYASQDLSLVIIGCVRKEVFCRFLRPAGLAGVYGVV